MLKVNNKDIWRRSPAFIINFEQISHILLVVPLLTLNSMYRLGGFHIELWTDVCHLGNLLKMSRHFFTGWIWTLYFHAFYTVYKQTENQSVFHLVSAYKFIMVQNFQLWVKLWVELWVRFSLRRWNVTSFFWVDYHNKISVKIT